MIQHGDCLEEMKKISHESIDLIYLDPPFFTQKKQKLTNKHGKVYEFSDNWESRKEYLYFLEERIKEMKRILKRTGSLFLHCDSTCSHYIKVLLDNIFGEENFRSEIIWSYKRWSNSKKGLLKNHQTIFFYSKTKDYFFKTIYENYSSTTNLDQILQERMRDGKGKTKYKINKNGEIIYGKEKKGVPLSDVWEIPYLNPKAKERTGYPTQKPILLLEQIIEMACPEKGIVLDPFCGSGTTLVAAKLLKREYIGYDTSEEAIKLAKERIGNPIKTDSMLLKNGREFYDTKEVNIKNVLNTFNCQIVQRNKGLDGILKVQKNQKYVGVKIQREEETLLEAIEQLKKAMIKRDLKESILIQTKDDLFSTNDCYSGIKIINSYEKELRDFIANKN